MKEYMINIKLPQQLNKDFVALIPKQRAQVSKLMEEGKIIQYALAADRSLLWITMIAKSQREVMDILSTLPLIHYMNPEIHALAFHNSISNDLPKLIMN